jgi:hypothetical protein
MGSRRCDTATVAYLPAAVLLVILFGPSVGAWLGLRAWTRHLHRARRLSPRAVWVSTWGLVVAGGLLAAGFVAACWLLHGVGNPDGDPTDRARHLGETISSAMNATLPACAVLAIGFATNAVGLWRAHVASRRGGR